MSSTLSFTLRLRSRNLAPTLPSILVIFFMVRVSTRTPSACACAVGSGATAHNRLVAGSRRTFGSRTLLRQPQGRHRHAADDDDLLALFPVRDPQVRLIAFDVDVSIYLRMTATDSLSKTPAPGRSFLVAFARSGGARRGPLLVDETTAEILEICDGTQTVCEIFQHDDRCHTGFDEDAQRKCIAELLTSGLVSLQDRCIDFRVAPRPLRRIEVRSSLRSEVPA
jgi:hypothetical protein